MLVSEVFSSVASSDALLNDLMSLGILETLFRQRRAGRVAGDDEGRPSRARRLIPSARKTSDSHTEPSLCWSTACSR